MYRLQSKTLNDDIAPTFKEDKEFRKQELSCKIIVLKNIPIKIEVYCDDENSVYYGEKVEVVSNVIPSEAINSATTREKIIAQISKTGSTPFEFKEINLELGDNLFVPIGSLNEIRRSALDKLTKRIIERDIISRNLKFKNIENNIKLYEKKADVKVNLLLNILDKNFDYSKLNNIDRLYIPLKYFILPDFKDQLKNICDKFKTYLYMPNILRDTVKIDFDSIPQNFKLQGFVISAINQLDTLSKYNLELIGNYTLNVYNSNTINSLKSKGISEICITPELNDLDTKNLIDSSSIPLELMVYGRIPFMTMNYCVLGKSNKCYKDCSRLCKTNKKYYLKDRMGFEFLIVPDNSTTITTIYNSKITSFDYSDFKIDSARISIVDENPNQIQNIIDTVKKSNRLEGKNYCGHFNK